MKRKLHSTIAAIAFMVIGHSVSAQTEVVYNFDSGIAGVVSNTAAAAANTFSTFFDNGSLNTSKILQHYASGSAGTVVDDLTNIPSTRDYSITWKQYISTAGGYKTGFVLRGKDAATYATGIKTGYFAYIEYNTGPTSTGSFVFKARTVSAGTGTGTGLGTASQSSNIYPDGGSTAFTLNRAYWFRVSISGTSSVVIKFEYSVDGTNFTTGYTYTDNSGTYQNAGVTQIVAGLGSGYTNYFIDDLKFNDPPATNTTWNGSAWDNGAPVASSTAIINGNYSEAANIVAASLKVKGTAVAALPSGNYIKLSGAVSVDNTASLTLENNAKLIQTNDVGNIGAINVKRNAAPMVLLDYTLWSSPVAAQNLFAFSPNTVTTPNARFYAYNSASDSYDNTGIIGTSIFTAGKGYAVRAPNTFNASPAVFTGIFTGVPNNGTISVALDASNQGFNLLGNPYPSPIDATAFVTANSSLIDGTLYFFSHNAKSDGTAYETSSGGTGMQYATWNGTGGTAAAVGISGIGQNTSTPNGTIQVGQGFIVKASAAGNLSFTNAMRTVTGTPANADQFFKMVNTKSTTAAIAATDKHRLWLNLNNESGDGLSQLLVGYVDGATNEVDNLYDGEEFGNPKTSLTSLLNDKNYTIQGRALPFADTDTVPLAFKAAANGTYTIALNKTDGIFAADQEVLLKDNVTGTVTNLKTGGYTFTVTAGTANSRFELAYSKSAINSMGLEALITAVKKQGVFQINTNGAILKDVAVYDIQGHEILKQQNINNTTSSLTGLPSTRGIFILKVTTDDNQTQTIKIIN